MDITYLHECFDADFEAGTLTWKHRPVSHFPDLRASKIWNTKYSGKAAGSTRKDGYKRVAAGGKDMLAHRVIFALFHGKAPKDDIDHIDGNPSNNSISNLRDVPHHLNLKNQKLSAANTSGHAGVYYSKRIGKWCAQMKHKQKTWHLGSFKQLADAVAARKQAEEDLGFTGRTA